jgi:subtilase family serine protease
LPPRDQPSLLEARPNRCDTVHVTKTRFSGSGGQYKLALGAIALFSGLAMPANAFAGPQATSAPGDSGQSPAGAPPWAYACATPAAQSASCGAIQLEEPSVNWHPGALGNHNRKVGGSTSAPSSGYYPADLQSAYGLASAAASFTPGPNAPTVAIVDAYDDPNAASDLATYRAAMSGATDPNTGLVNGAFPPLCSSGQTSGCVSFTKLNQYGGTSYPRGNTGWSEEISLDLDMVSAVCPDCNIVLVEASSNSFSNLDQAVAEAQSLHPAAITNSYGGSEFSTETSYNSTYSYSASGKGTAVTAATGDSGYGVEFPAAAPGVTAVGGTSLTYTGSGSGISWAETVWSGSGAGCSSYEAMPSWQDVQGVYASTAYCTGRQVADVSAVADPNTGVAVYDTYNEPGWMVFGGTSASTQIIGGVYGLAAGAGTLQPSPAGLYPDGASGATGSTPGLLPVTSGSDGNCGDYLCNASYSLSSGYNGPAGLGTPEGVGAFQASTSSTPNFTLSASPSSETVTAGGSATYTVSVSPSGGFNDSVTLSVSGLPSGASANFSPDPATSSSTLSVSTSTSTPAGTYTLTITGTGGGINRSATVSLVVQSSAPAGTMSVSVSAGSATRSGRGYKVPLTVTADDATTGAPISGASVVLSVYAGPSCSGTPAASGTGTTGSNGQVGFTFTTRTAGTWCALATVTASGYTDGSGETTFST